MPKFIYGSFIYEYALIRQERKTLSLTVKPDLSIILKAPHVASDERIEQFLKRKWLWLEKQLSTFKRYQRKLYKKEYVTGESFFYLGRQYKLIIKRANEEGALLTKGQIHLFTVNRISNTECNERILKNWYQKKRKDIFVNRLNEMVLKFNFVENPQLLIKEMRTRWGSYTENGRVILNPKLIYTSTDCIDYVIIHELCHSQHKNHDNKFYTLLMQKCPRWKKLKEKLEMYYI